MEVKKWLDFKDLKALEPEKYYVFIILHEFTRSPLAFIDVKDTPEEAEAVAKKHLAYIFHHGGFEDDFLNRKLELI